MLLPGSVALRWSRAVGASSSVTNSPSAVTTFKLPEVSVKARGLVVRTLVPPQVRPPLMYAMPLFMEALLLFMDAHSLFMHAPLFMAALCHLR